MFFSNQFFKISKLDKSNSSLEGVSNFHPYLKSQYDELKKILFIALPTIPEEPAINILSEIEILFFILLLRYQKLNLALSNLDVTQVL